MTKFIKIMDVTDAEKHEISEMAGKIYLWVMEKRSIDYMSKQLNLTPREIMENMCEIIYQLLPRVGGPRRYLKWLIHKR